jgi:hypothetical protein
MLIENALCYTGGEFIVIVTVRQAFQEKGVGNEQCFGFVPIASVDHIGQRRRSVSRKETSPVR